jgi:hypothetical protein
MNMNKVLCMVLVFTLALAFAACSSPTAQDSTPAASQEATVARMSEPTTTESAADVVAFADPVLEERVREQMNKPEGDITLEEAQAVTALDLENKDNASEGCIKDLSGLENFKNLKSLKISLNNISDLSPIAGMNLEVFYSMNGNQNITDFSPLAGSTDMLDLAILGDDNINDSSIGFIDGMTKLQILWIQDEPNFTDISMVANFPNLTKLDLTRCGVSDISPTAGLANLTEVYLKGNPIEDYSPLTDVYPNLVKKDFELE